MTASSDILNYTDVWDRASFAAFNLIAVLHSTPATDLLHDETLRGLHNVNVP